MYEAVNTTIKGLIKPHLDQFRENWINEDVVIPIGKYKGRKGKITGINFDSFQGVCMQFQPYRQERRGSKTITTTDLLWDDRHARSFWATKNFDELKKWVE